MHTEAKFLDYTFKFVFHAQQWPGLHHTAHSRAFLAVSASNQLIDLDYSNEVLPNQQVNHRAEWHC